MLDDESGLTGRKPVQRTAAERAAIVAESYGPGATVAGVARKHGIVASQLSSWRSAARRRSSVVGGSTQFADVAIMPEAPLPTHDGVEIIAGPVVIRLPKSTPSKRVVDIARQLARQE